MNRILVLAPHTDDGEFGCGATISKLIEEGCVVNYVAFSACEESVPIGFPRDILKTEVRKAVVELGIEECNLNILDYKVRHFSEKRQNILDDLIELRRRLNPDLVFCPSSYDTHQDHRVIFEECRRAFKRTSILGYEFIWNNFSFHPTYFSIVKEKHIKKKINAIAQYSSQSSREYSKEDTIRGLAKMRGLQISQEFVEAYEVIRLIK